MSLAGLVFLAGCSTGVCLLDTGPDSYTAELTDFDPSEAAFHRFTVERASGDVDTCTVFVDPVVDTGGVFWVCTESVQSLVFADGGRYRWTQVTGEPADGTTTEDVQFEHVREDVTVAEGPAQIAWSSTGTCAGPVWSGTLELL